MGTAELTKLEEAARRATEGVRDHAAMKEAAKRMDRLRKEVRRRHGEIQPEIIREIRDE